jgi:hypothetical protein
MLDPVCLRSVVTFSNSGEGKNTILVDTSHMSTKVSGIVPMIVYSTGRNLVTLTPSAKITNPNMFEIKFTINEHVDGLGTLSIRFLQ